MTRRHLRALPLALLALVLAPSAARAFDVPAGATYSQGYVTESDGTKIHYDLLRPKDLPKDARTPTLLSIGPYFGHAGQTGASGPIEDATYDPTQGGPSDRFRDFIDGAKLMQRGYSWIQFDLRGFGASSGCLDWGGPGEQADVKAAVEWTASQPWSTGKVGMYGKSYDGVTGLIGAVSNPKGLAAVVSQEPVYDLYRYLYADGIRFTNSLLTPALYELIDSTGGPTTQDDGQAVINSAQSPPCYAQNYLGQQSDDHASGFWKARDFVHRAKDVKTPLFLTQGFLENNTKPDGAYDFWNAVTAPKRAWFGMWDHVRGNDVDADTKKLAMGRAGWFDEVMRFFDHYVRDVPLADAPVDKDPPIAVQTNDGSWRAESAWPPADATTLTAPLKAGSYTDDAMNTGGAEAEGNPVGALASPGHGIWTFSPPLAHDAHFAGVPVVTATLTTVLPRANFVADVYDVDAAGKATLISRGARRVDASGKVTLPLYGDDWKLPAGHRVGVLLTGSNSEWWLHVPTGQPVTVAGASITLPFLGHTRSDTIQGDGAARLKEYLDSNPFQVDAATIAAGTSPSFPLPAALTPLPKGGTAALGAPAGTTAAGVGAAGTAGAAAKTKAPRLVARIARRGKHSVVVYGNAPTGYRVSIAVNHDHKRVARKATTARLGAFRTTIPVKGRKAWRLRATVTAVKGTTKLVSRTKYVRLPKLR